MALLALAFSLLASGVVWNRLSARHDGELSAFFALERSEIATRIEERFRSYRKVLDGARGFIEATGVPGRVQWAEYVRRLRLDEDYAGMLGLGFAAWIPPEALGQHVLEMREGGFPYYRVWPGGEREAYSAVTMIAPFDWRNQRVLGFDMYSDPVRREAMERAARTGGGALSGRVILMQETAHDRQAGVVMYLPVYARGVSIDTEHERRRALLGWVFSPFRMNDLMQGLLGAYSEAMRLRVYDRTVSPENLLYDSHEGREPHASPELSGSQRLDVNGQDWILVADALPGFASTFDIRQIEVLATGLVGLLLVVATWSFWSTLERARKLAHLSESVRRSEARYSTLVNLAHEGVAAADADLRLTFVNPRLAEMLGRDAASLLGRRLDEFCAEDAPQTDREEVLRRMREGQGGRHEVQLTRGDGSEWTALLSSAPLSDSAGHLRGIILMVADISERKEAERRIAHLATHDTLTGLPNRRLFSDQLTLAVEQARRYRHRCALLFVDLDHFKEVNDSHGHAVGDRLLREAVGRMANSIRTSDTLARQGGDEFVVLLPEVESAEDAEVVAEKIRNALDIPFLIDGLELHISSSIGIALFPDDGADEEALSRCADEAMYRAKSEGRNRVRHYSAGAGAMIGSGGAGKTRH